MAESPPRPGIKVHRGIYEVFGILQNKGMLELVKTNKEKGIIIVLTHLKLEFEASGDPRFRDAHEWIVKHRDDFIWGVSDGFTIG